MVYKFTHFAVNGETFMENDITIQPVEDTQVTAHYEEEKEVSVFVDLVERTVKNKGTEDITLTELKTASKTVTPNETVTLDPKTIGFTTSGGS